MKGFFRCDGYLWKIMTVIMYVVGLNLLFLLCCVPILTIGASNTAMYAVLLRYQQGEEPDILRGFFRAFRDNFGKSTLIWILMLILAGTLGLNYYFLHQNQIPAAAWIRVLLNLILIALIVLWVYVFPAIACFENSVKGYLVYCISLAAAKLPATILLLLIQTLPLLTLLFLAQYLPPAVLLLICCGGTLPAWFSGRVLLRLFGLDGEGAS